MNSRLGKIQFTNIQVALLLILTLAIIAICFMVVANGADASLFAQAISPPTIPTHDWPTDYGWIHSL